MSTFDYRRGVEDALSALGDDGSIPDVAKAYVRKKLLTKKVTRWVNMYQGHEGIQTGFRSTYDTKEYAESYSKFPDLGAKYIGTFPIEIEVPL